jgi:MYXO-CTERM domain-containing protein
MGYGMRDLRIRLSLGLVALLSAFAALPADAQNGLRREVWDRTGDPFGGSPNAEPPPGSAITNPAPFVEAPVLTDVVPNIAYADWPGGVAPIPDDYVYAAFTGNITPTVTGDHAFGARSDDGIRIWVNNVLVHNDWVDQGAPGAGAPEMNVGGAVIPLTAGTPYAFRVEWYERQGGDVCEVWWQPPGGALAIIPTTVLTPPAPPAAPVLSGTAGYQMNSLSWTAPTGAISYILEVSVGGGAYTQIYAGTGNSFVHTGLTNGTAYTYQVRAVGNFGLVSANSTPPLVLTPFAPPPRTNSHDEGLFGDNCACGSSIPAPVWPALAGLAGLALMAVRRRR